MSTFWLWNFAILCGVLAGGVMFCRVIPLYVKKIDVCARGADKNPGAANVFALCGPVTGTICLILDLAKGFAPVYLTAQHLPMSDLRFGLLMPAARFGTCTRRVNHWNGGKHCDKFWCSACRLSLFTDAVIAGGTVYSICRRGTYPPQSHLQHCDILYIWCIGTPVGIVFVAALCRTGMFTDFLYRHLPNTPRVRSKHSWKKKRIRLYNVPLNRHRNWCKYIIRQSTQETEQSDEEETQTPHRVS